MFEFFTRGKKEQKEVETSDPLAKALTSTLGFAEDWVAENVKYSVISSIHEDANNNVTLGTKTCTQWTTAEQLLKTVDSGDDEDLKGALFPEGQRISITIGGENASEYLKQQAAKIGVEQEKLSEIMELIHSLEAGHVPEAAPQPTPRAEQQPVEPAAPAEHASPEGVAVQGARLEFIESEKKLSSTKGTLTTREQRIIEDAREFFGQKNLSSDQREKLFLEKLEGEGMSEEDANALLIHERTRIKYRESKLALATAIRSQLEKTGAALTIQAVEVYKEVVEQETLRLNAARIQEWPPREHGKAMRLVFGLYQRWTKTPAWLRVGISATVFGIATGGGNALLTGAGIARRAIAGSVGVGNAKVIKKLVDIYAEKKIENIKNESSEKTLEALSTEGDLTAETIAEIEREQESTVQEIANAQKRALQLRIFATALTGLATGYGLNQFFEAHGFGVAEASSHGGKVSGETTPSTHPNPEPAPAPRPFSTPAPEPTPSPTVTPSPTPEHPQAIPTPDIKPSTSAEIAVAKLATEHQSVIPKEAWFESASTAKTGDGASHVLMREMQARIEHGDTELAKALRLNPEDLKDATKVHRAITEETYRLLKQDGFINEKGETLKWLDRPGMHVYRGPDGHIHFEDGKIMDPLTPKANLAEASETTPAAKPAIESPSPETNPLESLSTEKDLGGIRVGEFFDRMSWSTKPGDAIELGGQLHKVTDEDVAMHHALWKIHFDPFRNNQTFDELLKDPSESKNLLLALAEQKTHAPIPPIENYSIVSSDARLNAKDLEIVAQALPKSMLAGGDIETISRISAYDFTDYISQTTSEATDFHRALFSLHLPSQYLKDHSIAEIFAEYGKELRFAYEHHSFFATKEGLSFAKKLGCEDLKEQFALSDLPVERFVKEVPKDHELWSSLISRHIKIGLPESTAEIKVNKAYLELGEKILAAKDRLAKLGLNIEGGNLTIGELFANPKAAHEIMGK